MAMGLESLRPLVATKLRIVALLAIPLVLVGGALAVGVLGAPSLGSMQNSFGDVDETETVIETDLVIVNPNPFGISLEDVAVNYTVTMNQVEMAEGSLGGIAIERGNTSVALESTMRNDGIGEWWTSHIAADEVTTVDIDLTITSGRLGRTVNHTHTTTVETNILEAFNSDETREVNADDALVEDPVLYINETRAEWGAVTDTETAIDMEFRVYNPKLEPYVITRTGYEITMNDVVVGTGETQEEHVIESRSHAVIALTTAIDATTLDEWWVTHLDEDVIGHQVSELRIDFHAIIELPTGDTVRVPLEQLTYEEFVTTDFFDEGGEVGVPQDLPEDDEAEIDEETGNESTEDSDGETDEDGTEDSDEDDGGLL